MFLFPSLLASFVLLSTLAVAQQGNGSKSTTVSLWLPWLPQGLNDNLQASVINAQSNATTYLLSCPTSIKPSSRNATAICALGEPETVTANPTTVLVSASTSGTSFNYECQYAGTTKPATCLFGITAASYVSAGKTGPLVAEGESVYPTNSIKLQPVTVTAGNLTPGTSTATSIAPSSATSSGTTAATSKPTNGGVAVGLGSQGSWGAVGAGFVGLAMGMM